MRFMVSRRWVLFAVVVAALAYGCYWLGQWQFLRLQERVATNVRTTQNLKAEPAPVDEVLSRGEPTDPADEWRRVTATGTYVPDESVVIRYQTRDGTSGVDVVTPLRTATGTALLVDRGWLDADRAGAAADPPAPPGGEVTVVGWVRADATGDAARVTDGSARAVSSVAIARTTDLPLYGGFVDMKSESPAAAQKLVPAELPDLSNGPHFFYGLQWWFFGLLAVFGFCYLAYDERRRLHAPPATPPPPSDPRSRDEADQAERTANWVS